MAAPPAEPPVSTPGGCQGGLQGGFQVRPEELTDAGQCAQAIAARIPSQSEQTAAAAEHAAAALSGWRTAAALRACGDSWRALLATLAGELASQGQRLATTAQQYRDGEVCATDAFVPASLGSWRSPAAPAQSADAAGSQATDLFGTTLASR
ncbi:hypothetical protein [Kitasatospora kifunensis]|uniref:Uncharacterized protein n=1 Tax=Kitasatospora kifunensis TaxID=58351 RepID=A0A7W7VV14_KITKI|nr:hypothetical protein [Kitasatospora kifunensis]MBB4923922.1 hypothetical protein [Kitasatospora kifunensis]